MKFTAEEIKKYMNISFSKLIFKHMDKFALPVKTTVFFTLLLLVLVFGYSDPLFLSADKISDFFSEVKGTYFALPVTIIIFCILAFMNILPIPALDGGHVMFLIYEMIAGKAPSDQFLTRAQVVGMVLLFSLLIYANGMDVYRFMSS